MTTQTRNEAAELLREAFDDLPARIAQPLYGLAESALQVERRATVERIRGAAHEARQTPKGYDRTPAEAWERLMAFIEKEAAR